MLNGQPQFAEIAWRDGSIPVAAQFDDPYFSSIGGLEETRHVYLAGNDVPRRFRKGFHIAELGFGTGLNMVAAWQAWRESGQEGALRYTSFEAFPMRPDEMFRALSVFDDVRPLVQKLRSVWPLHAPCSHLTLDQLQLVIIPGDARDAIRFLKTPVDAWFLDGFSPAKNPELWDDCLLADVGAITAPNGTFATYSAAGHVRRKLEAAGFDVVRRPGFGSKRHMSVGVLRGKDGAE